MPRDAKVRILDAKAGEAIGRFDLDFETLRQWQNDARQPAVTRLILMQRFDSVPPGEALIDKVIAALAAIAAGLWPVWCSNADFSELRPADSGGGRTPVEDLLAGLPGASPIWFAWAARRMLAGRSLAPNGFSRDIALRQLALAISREGLILVIAIAETSPVPGLLLGLVHAVQWLARRGLAVVVLLPPLLEGRHELAALAVPQVERTTEVGSEAALASPEGLSEGASERSPGGLREGPPSEPPDCPLDSRSERTTPLGGAWQAPPTKAVPREVSPGPVQPAAVPPAVARDADDLWLWPVTGRPHPLSEGEHRLAAALRQDADLHTLFSFNCRVRTIYQSEPIVDLLWAEGRVVVEVDGESHRQADQYAADRHRDFELLVSGYAVLRLSNEEVLTDTARAVAKIRKVVSFRQHPPPETGFA